MMGTMLELLILYSLFDYDLTTYSVRKYIVEHFKLFKIPSLGAIHPAIKRLINKKYITISKNISNGGLKSCKHHLTPEGKKYFYTLFTEDTSNTPITAIEQIKIKIMLLDKFSEKNDEKNLFFTIALNKIELFLLDIKNILENSSKLNEYTKLIYESMQKDLVDLKSLLQKLKKDCGD